MRLLHTKTLELHEFIGDNVPKYAILSHTWGEEEVSYQEIIAEARPVDRAGYLKITASCQQASRDGWEYIWIDTCCIDKTSSAELSEAVNSMFRWYQRAQICYAYMVNVDIHPSLPKVEDPNQLESFRRSRWFTRGWTLQELLAPKSVIFFDCEWRTIGNKIGLRRDISWTTNIQSRYVVFPKEASVAAKMSWASKRETTRTEDLAYCLMGLFDVNMPLIYGEGHKAFTRLQHEILRVNPDESLFAWRDPGLSWSGMFANAPAAFADSGNIIPFIMQLRKKEGPMSMTNRGLATRARLWLPDEGVKYFDVKDTPLRGPSHEILRDGEEMSQALRIRLVDDCLLLSCKLNYESDTAISIIVRKSIANSMVRFEPGMLVIHHLDHALSRIIADTQKMFVQPIYNIRDGIAAKEVWIRVRRAPFGRRLSLLHYDRFEDATVVRGSHGLSRQQTSWEIVIELPLKDEKLWFCTEDNDLFVIVLKYYEISAHTYLGKYSSDQVLPELDISRSHDVNWKSLAIAESPTATQQGDSFNWQLPSLSYVSINLFTTGEKWSKFIDIVVDRQPFHFFYKVSPSTLQRLKSSMVNALSHPSS